MDPLSAEFEDRIKQEASKATKEQLRKSLELASAEIDRICNFKGQKANPRQEMSWPRVGATDKAGKPVIGVPKQVEDAAYFLSSALLAGYQIGPEDRDTSIGLVAAILLRLDGILDEENPTNNHQIQ